MRFSFLRLSRKGLLVLLFGICFTARGAEVGSTVGQFAVQSGTATYAIPLVIPPGLGEMKPELALTYSSVGGDGPLGEGWSITGLSAITLCSQTLAQDNQYIPVTKSSPATEQRFCLDGQRLVPVSGSHGTVGQVLRTEIDNFSRVTIDAWSGAVPTSFTVKTKAGQTLRYGTSQGSRSHDDVPSSNPPIAWFVDRITDAKGNFIRMTYARGTATSGAFPETVISKVEYTGNTTAGLDPYASVTFKYGARSTSSYYFGAGYRFQRSLRLNSIQTAVGTIAVRNYRIGYTTVARTGASAVGSIQECSGDSTSSCLPATTFTWNQSDLWMNAQTVNTSTTWGGAEWVRTGDFNGDGLTDIASPDGGYVHMQLGKPFGGFDSVRWNINNHWGATESKWLQVGDFNGDGRTDFAFPYNNMLMVKLADPKNGRFNDWWALSSSVTWGNSRSTFVAEMNGDGVADIVSFVAKGTGAQQALVLLGSRTGAITPEYWSYSCNQCLGDEARENFAFDFNGDGITDVVGLQNSFVHYLMANHRTKSFAVEMRLVSSGFGDSDTRLRWIADFDGDGMAEVGLVRDSTARVDVYPPVSRGVPQFSYSLPAAIPSGSKDWTWCFDQNGDGLADIVTKNGTNIYAYLVNPAAVAANKLVSSSMSWGEVGKTFQGDFNGDGLTDIASRTSSSSINMLYSERQRTSVVGAAGSAQPDAIASITSGDGAIINIEYRTMGQVLAGNTAVDLAAAPPAGESIVAAPMWLAYEVHTSHGAGPATATRGTRYQYFNLHMSNTGRGVLGFEAESVRDLLTGDWEITYYETTWPRNGQIKRKNSYLEDGSLTKSLVQVTDTLTTAPGLAYPYVTTSTETIYNDAGSPLTTTTTNYSQIDIYGNVGQIVMTNGDTGLFSTKTTQNTYEAADTSNWILGRLTKTSVQHAVSNGVPSITRTSAFTYGADGLLESETVEPDSADPKIKLNTVYEYDVFGHKKTVTVTGAGWSGVREPRVTRTSINTSQLGSGYMDTTVTQEVRVGQTVRSLSSTQRLSLAHGGVISATDPNGVTVTTEYDGFGRKTRQSQGSTIWSAWSYLSAAGAGGNAVQKVVSTSSAGAESTVYLDLMGREVRKDVIALDGRLISTSTRFDEQGRVVEATRPSFDGVPGASVYTRYDDRGRIIEVDAPGPSGSRAKTLTSHYANGIETVTTDPLGRFKHELRNALGQTVWIGEGAGTSQLAFQYDAVGNVWRTVDAAGQITTIQYDVRGRKTRMLDPAMGELFYGYNSFGDLEWQYDATKRFTYTDYDSIGRMVSRLDPGESTATKWNYDTAAFGLGQIATITHKDGFVESYAYNSVGLVTSVTKRFRTPNQGALEDFTTSTIYDNQNRPWKVTRPGGFTTENVYDTRGYLVAVRSPKATTEGGLEQFDSSALQARITEIMNILPGYQNSVSSLTQQASAAESAANGWETEAAQVEAQTYASASASDRQYIETARSNAAFYRQTADTLNGLADQRRAEASRLDSHAQFYINLESESQLQAQHWLDLFEAREQALEAQAQAERATAAANEASADSAETLMQQNEAQANARYAQIMSAQQTRISSLRTQAATGHSNADQLELQRDAAQANVSRLQAQLAMLQANTSDTANITWWRASNVDAEGRISQEALGNGLMTRRTYDAATGHLLEIKTGGAGIGTSDNDLQDVGYAYDAADNVQYRWDHNVQVTANYEYDALDRLTSMRSVHPGAAALTWTKGYTYDPVGNITAASYNGASINYTYSGDTVTTADGYWATPRKRVTSVANVGNVVYDANGNITQSGNRTLTFNSANYPLTVTDGSTSAAFTYGPDRQRLTRDEVKSGGWTMKTAYGGGGYERSHIANGSASYIEHRYAIVVNGRLVADRIRTEFQGTSAFRAEYYHEDALNSVELVTDSLGRILKRFYYDPFGMRADITGYIDAPGLVRQNNPFHTYMQRGFTGHEQLDELGLIHMNGRMYDTQLRRFLSADPNVQAPNDTQSYNRYAYVKNNPLKYTDPSGFFFKKLLKGIKKFWRPLLAMAITIIAPYLAPAAWGAFGAVAFGAAGGFLGGLVASGGDLRAGLVGAVSGAAFAGIGQGVIAETINSVQKVVLHGAVGGLSSVAQGGKFGAAFLSSTFSSMAGGLVPKGKFGVVAAAVVGGTASELGGGKFANGAVTGAFSYASSKFATSVKNQLLTYTDVGTPVKGSDGWTDWKIKWGLSQPAEKGGWIVQEVTVSAQAYDANGVLMKGSGTQQYWEAWQVNAGSQGTTEIVNWDDHFRFRGVAGSYSGSVSWSASARYYDGLDLPDTFQPNSVKFAGDFYATITPPNLSGGTPAVTRSFSNSW